MGQQQLLLLVLGAIIVGLAIVVGINLFSDSALQANRDAVRQDLLTIMSRAEEWYRKPTLLGGGGKDLSKLSNFGQMGYQDTTGVLLADGVDYWNQNGTYALGTASASEVTITGTCHEDNTVKIAYKLSVTNGKTKIEEAAVSTGI